MAWRIDTLTIRDYTQLKFFLQFYNQSVALLFSNISLPFEYKIILLFNFSSNFKWENYII